MITTDFVPGSPCWLDLGTPDVNKAARFYRSVFGWELQSLGPDAEGYGFLQLDGKTVGGVGPLGEDAARSAWMIYFNTSDATNTAASVERLHGSVRVAPIDINGQGRMAQLTDPLGGQFAIWQPGQTKGFEVADDPGALMWIELYTTDSPAAQDFYRNLFGWTSQDMPMPAESGGTYTIIGPAGKGEERMHGGIMQLPAEYLAHSGGRPYWHPVFHVTDCDDTVAAVSQNGGSVQMGPETMEGVGRMAVCLDPAGADFVVLTPAPRTG